MATAFQEINWDAVTKFDQLTPQIRTHVKNVYTTLFATICAAALGGFVFVTYNIGGTWSFLAGFGLLIWLAETSQEEVGKRLSILAAFGFVEGLAVGPLLELAIDIDPTIVFTAFVGSCAVFGCFSASALLAQRRSLLYIGGMLSSALSLLLILSLMNIFFHSSMVATGSIYLGLIVFSGFIIFDTQLMVERAAHGNTDFVWDALNLFLDFANLFVRILAILAKNKKSNK